MGESKRDTEGRPGPVRWEAIPSSGSPALHVRENAGGGHVRTDLLLARATFAAAVKRRPGAKITLRNGARILEKAWPADG
jgi:hypothetical protein